MDFGKRKSPMASGWMQAAIFNAMLLLLPVLAANVVVGVFAARDFPNTPRVAALEATRAEIRAQFSELTANSENPRETWARLVDLQLRERNMAAARGFMLSAPEMLDPRDREAVTQAAPQALPFGTEDEQLIGAALLFLPNDVRVRYETANALPTLNVSINEPDDGAPADETDAPQEPDTDDSRTSTTTPPSVRRSAEMGFSVLGSFEDLVRQARNWASGDDLGDALGFRITGLGLIADALDTPADVDLREAVSLLRAAERAQRLHPGFVERLTQRVDAALPLAPLRVRVNEVVGEVAPTSEHAEGLRSVFLTTLDQNALVPLYRDMHQINEIVDATSPVATLALLEHVRSGSDLRRARLIAEASGDRAVALEAISGEDVLRVARTGVELGQSDVLEIMGLAAAAMALFWMVLLGMQRYLRSPIQVPRYE